jgi:hypothetical protein
MRKPAARRSVSAPVSALRSVPMSVLAPRFSRSVGAKLMPVECVRPDWKALF